ncbi:response regulator [Bradyrhizobium sp. GCM10027634]|uniref:response regulator n=1 Tax=unclassified Bradyrhizobium TaxID=2631580 RepID=UPI00188A9CA9|nr:MULTISPECIES: response regulator [unclassified Bradyrhizobium]MDN4999344.1 response regulator [Bradyrhizobium sp. WYCCWR 12677]QOZ48613.1 response regulator [Bradyrhizobium sp. CCBAU 53340]
MPEAKSIYVVDDDQSMRTSIGRLLREYGYAAKLFDSARALLSHGRFDQAICMIIDINLENGSGIDLRQQLLRQGITAPIVFITGNDSEAHRAEATKVGCAAYLTKPFSAKSLIASMARARGPTA